MMFTLSLASTMLSTFLLCTISYHGVNAAGLPLRPFSWDAQFSEPLRRTVYNPKIINPNSETVWTIGSKATVTWDHVPKDITNKGCTIYLGWLDLESTNEHLDIEHPLAHDKCHLDRGYATFTVPEVPPRSDYIVVVMGDSGNHSPTFSIKRTSP